VLELRKLEIEDFGPFKGKQRLEFPQEDGVSIIYGENMRGKTSLLNAIRFAFFGRVIGRGSQPAPLHTIGNWEQAASGKYGFSVRLEFQHEGELYALTRRVRPRLGVVQPQSDQDYATEETVERGGVVLSKADADAAIKTILPEQISRFFLFDSELLQEYEELLRSGSDMGRRISEAIERILGVPVLTRARAMLSNVKDVFEQRAASEAQKNAKTQQIGNQISSLKETKRVLQDELTRLSNQLNGLRTKKTALDEDLRRRERLIALMERRDNIERILKEAEGRRDKAEIELRIQMTGAWHAILRDRIRTMMKALRERERALSFARMRSYLAEHTPDDCPACLRPLTADVMATIRTAIATQGIDEGSLATLQTRVDALEALGSQDGKGVIRVQWSSYEAAKVDIQTAADEIAELDKQLEAIDEDEIRQARALLEQTIKEIDAVERGIDLTRGKIVQNDVDSDRLLRRLAELGGADLTGVRQRQELYSRLHELFDESVALYRARLRERVQTDASRFFRELTTESDYAGLRINESYGLTILHRDGTEIPVRSAGAEHVVALCLIGALQNNAPLRGPIVIDSPFGRLDRGHTTNIIQALPNMSRQIVLFVYQDELPADLARTALQGKLKAEWRLERRSARHTEIVVARG
jgi:DNA sulfur modification protein DndD